MHLPSPSRVGVTLECPRGGGVPASTCPNPHLTPTHTYPSPRHLPSRAVRTPTPRARTHANDDDDGDARLLARARAVRGVGVEENVERDVDASRASRRRRTTRAARAREGRSMTSGVDRCARGCARAGARGRGRASSRWVRTDDRAGRRFGPSCHGLDATWDPMTSGDRRESEESVMPLPESLPEITSGGARARRTI